MDRLRSEGIMFLAGDLGGTKTLLGEFEPSDAGLRLTREKEFPSRSYPSFEAILTEFLHDRTGPPLRSACFGVAGTVVSGRSQATNLPWSLDESRLAMAAAVPRVKLLNDLEATAYGVLSLPASELEVLHPSAFPTPGRVGNTAVIAAGTGLGEAMLYWDGREYHPIPSEAGHADFAPRNEREVDLWHYLRETVRGHISYERVLSGPGLRNIYAFLRDRGGFEEPPWLSDEIRNGDPNAVISSHGLAGDVPLCAETLSMFAEIYGAEAGNLALRCVAVGGVFLAGGIAPKLLPALRSKAFLDSFIEKGRYSSFLRGVEVSVCLNPLAALLGAAHYALRL